MRENRYMILRDNVNIRVHREYATSWKYELERNTTKNSFPLISSADRPKAENSYKVVPKVPMASIFYLERRKVKLKRPKTRQ